MILKLLLVIGVITAVYFIFFKKKPVGNRKNSKKDTQKQTLEANEMVECSNCGIYSELEESLLSNAKYYCSSKCANKDQ